jgi:hypothetical protein
MQRKRQSARRSGAVMVEALLSCTALVLLFACLSFMHLYTSHKIDSLEQAREKAWRRATHECRGDEPIFQDIVRDFTSGIHFPVPEGYIPTPLEDSASFAVPGLFGAKDEGGTSNVAFICSPLSSRAVPLKRPVDWVLGLFF